jgi:ribosome maturation factor RimP
LQFGKTVAEQVNLKQQFFEEAFINHLQLWEGTYIKLYDQKEVYTGRITKVTNEHVYLKKRSNTQEIAIRDITYINIMRVSTLFQVL